MSARTSIEEVLATLETQAAFHRERESFHAGQESLHREQRSHHAAELETITQRLEAFRAAAGAALDLAARTARPAEEDDHDLGPAYRPRLARMVDKILQTKKPNERFGPNGLTDEVNQRFAKNLRTPVDVRQISVVLRRMHRLGKIHLVRRGRPHWEALYVREGAD